MKKEIEIQQENLNILIQLMKENPTLKVIPMVNNEVVSDDGYCYWAGEFGKAEIDETWSNDNRIYFKSWDEDYLIDELLEDADFIKETDCLDENLQFIIAEQKINNLDWEKVIVVKIDTP